MINASTSNKPLLGSGDLLNKRDLKPLTSSSANKHKRLLVGEESNPTPLGPAGHEALENGVVSVGNDVEERSSRPPTPSAPSL